MRWRERGALVAAIVALLGAGAGADPTVLRDYVTGNLDAQLATVQRSRTAVDDKLVAASAQRARRIRAAYKLLRSGSAPSWIQPDERMATARRRAAARWLLARDRREEALLADEAAALAAAEARIAGDRTIAGAIALPAAGLDRPVRGEIARAFGPYQHERSKATLSRRGVDFEVDSEADVHPVADGIVLYAGPIRGLEHGLIIDHGTFVSVLGKLDPPLVAAGATVTRGQVIGHPQRRRVYLEVRIPVSPGGVPVDPQTLFARPEHIAN